LNHVLASCIFVAVQLTTA